VEGDEDISTHKRAFIGFNPRPRVEGDAAITRCDDAVVVSIRALAWRATNVVPEVRDIAQVSIRALAWRATTIIMQECWPLAVSIRALAWRATMILDVFFRGENRFNPRPRVEGDKANAEPPHRGNRFNPRPRVEGDTGIVTAIAILLWFQSAPSRGGRQIATLAHGTPAFVSIRALAWRATRKG